MTFWMPKRTGDSSPVFQLEVTDPVCVGPPEMQFLMGGSSMAAAIETAEATFDMPLLWATTQFMNTGMRGETVEFRAEKIGGGRNVIQAEVIASKAGAPIARMAAALGSSKPGSDGQFTKMPDVPAAADCPIKTDTTFTTDANLIGQFERRTAFEDNDAAVEHMWIRPKADIPSTAGLLAIISDFILGVHPLTRGGRTLDNTLRIGATAGSGWVLCARELLSITRGIAHIEQRLFFENGAFLASTSQTGLLPR
ncbi:MAG: hypothetical protein AAF950_06265 [Pseudomonadota bacterium]